MVQGLMNARGVACYPLNLEAQAAWHAARMQRPPGRTAVFVAARPARPDEVRRARTVVAMRKRARALGWRVNVTYAQGLPASGAHVVESLAVRMRYLPDDRPGWLPVLGACAVYHARLGAAYAFDCGFVWVTANFPILVKSPELNALLDELRAAPADPLEATLFAIDTHARIREAGQAKRAVAAAKAKETKARKVAA